MAFRDRIKRFDRVRAGDLHPSPWNWREHPLAQREAIEAVLSEIGFADACIARETADGKLETIDGHLRASLDPEQMVPVLVLDVTEDEAKKVLATLDPIAAMAATDAAAQQKLLGELEAEEAGLKKLLADMLASAEADEGGGRGDNGRAPDGPPEMDLRPHEHYDYVIVLARNTHEWNRLVELLDLPMVQSAQMRKTKIGVGRGVTAGRLISLLEAKAAPSHGNP